MSELMREAFRRYKRQREWDEANAYGRAKAKELGITEADRTVCGDWQTTNGDGLPHRAAEPQPNLWSAQSCAPRRQSCRRDRLHCRPGRPAPRPPEALTALAKGIGRRIETGHQK